MAQSTLGLLDLKGKHGGIVIRKLTVILMITATLVAALWWRFAPQHMISELEIDGLGSTWLIQSQNQDIVEMYLLFPFGEAHRQGPEGLAHYTEHLAAHPLVLDPQARAAHANAFTTRYATAYQIKAKTSDAQDALTHLLGVAQPLSATPSLAASEQQIILREHSARTKDNPEYAPHDRLWRDVIGDHPLARSALGTPQDIATFSLQSAQEWQRATHQLEHASLIIFGDITARHAKELLNTLPAPKTPTSAPSPLPRLRWQPATTVRDFANGPSAAQRVLEYRLITIPNCGSPARCTALAALTERSFDSALTGGIAGPLRYDAFIARRFSFSLYHLENDSFLVTFEAAPDSGVSLEQLYEHYHDTVEHVSQAPLPQEVFDRLHQRLMPDPLSPNAQARLELEHLLNTLKMGKKPFSVDDYHKALSTVTQDDLTKARQAIGQSTRIAIGYLH